MVELLFLASVYAPCPTCHGSRYNAETLKIRYRDKNIAEVLALTVDPHPADGEKLMAQLDGLVASGNTAIVVEHDMRVVAGSDWVIDIGPGAGEDGGSIVAAGAPIDVANARTSRTAPYLARFLRQHGRNAHPPGLGGAKR